MMLTFTLTDTEYVAVMHALRKASARRTLHTVLNEVEKLELEHLRTLLAEASVLCPRCNLPTAVCNETNRIVNKALDMLEDNE